ncbi:MAG: hypothetical protein LBR10_15410 [Prevotellaceae bacterium]|nr:hypothetical protein [Prevotellaceae bacterium]
MVKFFLEEPINDTKRQKDERRQSEGRAKATSQIPQELSRHFLGGRGAFVQAKPKRWVTDDWSFVVQPVEPAIISCNLQERVGSP